MNRLSVVRWLFLILALTLAGCGGRSESDTKAALNPLLNPDTINLIFVISPDLANDPLGDLNSSTANLNNQGLQRSLLMGRYLKQQLLEAKNVTAIHVLEPMTHLQTRHNYPDVAAIGFIQQFALLNQVTAQGTTAYGYPLYAGYAQGDLPVGVATPSPYIPGAQGLAFNDANGNNLALATRIINANRPGYYVFSAPWETTSAMLTGIKAAQGYDISLPKTYLGSNYVYVISIASSRSASLATFDSQLSPASTFPVLPPPGVESALGPQQPYFNYTRTLGVNGVTKIPAGTNTNQTVYLIRHAEAHPVTLFEDGNYVGAGQWRALSLPTFMPRALRGLSNPNVIYSIDPAQSFLVNNVPYSYVRPPLTVLPYAIANNLPLNLISGISLSANDAATAKATSDFLFTGGNLSNQTVLLAWEHDHFAPLITYLLQTYGATVPDPPFPPDFWASTDYDTIWTVTLDAGGNLTVNNALYEGIQSPPPFAPAPQF